MAGKKNTQEILKDKVELHVHFKGKQLKGFKLVFKRNLSRLYF